MSTLKIGKFPLLQEQTGLVYLDNASTTQKPERVIEALSQYYLHYNANVHRAVYKLAETSTQAYEQGREKVARFIGAASSREIIFTKGTTESLNLAAYTLCRRFLNEGDEVIVTQMDHHSNFVPWWLQAQDRHFTVKVWPITPEGELDLADLNRLWTDRVKIVSIPQISNVLGTINPVTDIAEVVHERGALLVLDAAQSVGHGPFNVKQLGCDLAAFSGHKMYGPQGIGVLWGKEEILKQLPPYQGGGEMISSVTEDLVTFNELPYKFEAGTPHVAGVVGLAAATDFLLEVGRDHIFQEEKEIARYGVLVLTSIPGLTLYGFAKERAPVFSFNIEGIHSHDLAQFLDSKGLAVRSGHHCAQPLLRALGAGSAVRASLGIYNTKADIDLLADALEEAKRYFL
ncbi:MAG: cysteine desulfurase [Spirochaetales bacterium]